MQNEHSGYFIFSFISFVSVFLNLYVVGYVTQSNWNNSYQVSIHLHLFHTLAHLSFFTTFLLLLSVSESLRLAFPPLFHSLDISSLILSLIVCFRRHDLLASLLLKSSNLDKQIFSFSVYSPRQIYCVCPSIFPWFVSFFCSWLFTLFQPSCSHDTRHHLMSNMADLAV